MNILVCIKQILDPDLPARDFKINAEAKETFLEAFGAMLTAVDAEEGTEIYILNWGQKDDENTAYIYELYTDTDALATHGGSDAMKTLMGALGDLLAGAPEMIMLTPAAGKGL